VKNRTRSELIQSRLDHSRCKIKLASILAVLAEAIPVLKTLARNAVVKIAACLVIGSVFGVAQADDLTAFVRIELGAAYANPATGTLDSKVVVTNISANTLLGPAQLALESASPANVAISRVRHQPP
jgi:predicted membrane protein